MTRCGSPGLKVIVGLAVILAFSTLIAFAQNDAAPPSRPKDIVIWNVPAFDALPDDETGRLARYGRSVIEATYAHIGPAASNPSDRYAGNNLACANCHLQGGLKKFGLPLVTASADYPAYSARTASEISIFDRVNQCLKRSMNGRPMGESERPMQAILAYLRVLSTNIPVGGTIIGAGSGAMQELDRAADPSRGAAVYARECAYCHRPDGLGVRHNELRPEMGYAVPPLWGPDSFNTGAGAARLITLANFVHNNMPNGTSWVAPTLGPEDAWDVAGFVLSQPRPQLAGLDRDFPNLLLKPVDASYPPFADGFSVEQHRYGPFAPIKAEMARLKALLGEVPNPNIR